MEMPKPGELHHQLARLAGKWTGEDRMFPTEWDPQGGTQVARWDNRVALNGFALVTDLEQEKDGEIVFSGHGIWTVDDAPKGEYTLHWFDSMGFGLEVFRGGWQGDRLIIESQSPNGNARLTYDLSQTDVLGSQMESSQDGESWTKMFEGRYERKS